MKERFKSEPQERRARSDCRIGYRKEKRSKQIESVLTAKSRAPAHRFERTVLVRLPAVRIKKSVSYKTSARRISERERPEMA